MKSWSLPGFDWNVNIEPVLNIALRRVDFLTGGLLSSWRCISQSRHKWFGGLLGFYFIFLTLALFLPLGWMSDIECRHLKKGISCFTHLFLSVLLPWLSSLPIPQITLSNSWRSRMFINSWEAANWAGRRKCGHFTQGVIWAPLVGLELSITYSSQIVRNWVVQTRAIAQL